MGLLPIRQRVVVTRSLQFIPSSLTEEVWNTTASIDYQPYSLSKTLAEKKAWEIADAQSQWDLIVVNPCLVLGPAFNTHF